jgi:beta-glucosidase
MDNFEWAAGYSQRWGLVRLDFDTLSRMPTSAFLYATVAGSNELPVR